MRSNRAALRVALTYNLRRIAVGDGDSEAEFDAESTIDALAAAIRAGGHEVVPCEATSELPRRLLSIAPDLVFNIAEGLRGLNRESLVPALCELLEIECTGADLACMANTLNKSIAKQLISHAGIPTPAFALLRTGREALPSGFAFPAIVKPIGEGSSKGILEKQVVESEPALRTLAQSLVERYRQPVLAEAFLPGREFTVALLGEVEPRVLPIMEIVFTDRSDPYPVYTFKSKFENVGVENKVPCDVPKTLHAALQHTAREAFAALGCRDIARIDLRLDAAGRVHFIECNPLPGMTPEFSDLCVMAKAEGTTYAALVAEIMAPALRRLTK
jgi:D-alanine-D-alanine ligase